MAREYALQGAKPSAFPAINFAAELNPQQLAAVQSPPGASLVIAGAGSGKTRTLTYRVAWLLSQGIPAWSILLLTFTNKASHEMLERVAALLPGAGADLWGGTFHSIGNRILRRHAPLLGYAQSFSILDREDQESLIAAAIAATGIDVKETKFPKPGVLTGIFSLAANTTRTLEETIEQRYDFFLEIMETIAAVRNGYEQRKRSANAVDFDDLLTLPVRLLREHPEVALKYQRQFQWILVDEYQDTNRVQADFVSLLGEGHGNVMVVGDDAQSIYSWRGADVENMLSFPEAREGTRVFPIETNYRSVPEILAVANAAILSNPVQFPKNLQSSRPACGNRPALVELYDSRQQAQFVSQRIDELLGEGFLPEEIAVLYRAHFHSMDLQMELTRRGIPFGITSGVRFFEQAHVKDVLAFIRFAANPRDEVAFKRAAELITGIGPGTAAKLWNAVLASAEGSSFATRLLGLKVPAKSRKEWEQFAHTMEEIAPGNVPLSPSVMIRSVMEAVYADYLQQNFENAETRAEDMESLAEFSTQFTDLTDFLSQMALLSNLDTPDARPTANRAAVQLSSIHQAKGLEWKVVFVIMLADGLFPGKRAFDEETIEEERRLFYVAVTRAMDQLYLSWPQLRVGADGQTQWLSPSRFLQEIPEELLERWQIKPPWG